jgi:hypothetical protein
MKQLGIKTFELLKSNHLILSLSILMYLQNM